MTFTRILSLTAAAAIAIGALATAPASADERSELKQRFAKRYKTLLALKSDGLIGETYQGAVEVVKPEYAKRAVAPAKKDSPTIAALLANENRDRKRLYQLIAKDTRTEPSVVARRNARRVFSKAKPNHFLKPRPDTWVRKKDLSR